MENSFAEMHEGIILWLVKRNAATIAAYTMAMTMTALESRLNDNPLPLDTRALLATMVCDIVLV